MKKVEMTRARKEYVLELAQHAFHSIEECADQNISDITSTYYNVMAEMFSAFLASTCETTSEMEDVLICFIHDVLERLECHYKAQLNDDE